MVVLSVLVDNRNSDWSVLVPLSALMALQELPGQMRKLEADNAQLRRELEALRNIQSQMMIKLGDALRPRKKPE